ncbi:MAG TPA: nuclear transport factor 2 family protein [Rhabdochlamydiaceae bacterium]|nr:nuclear transport factor 2 family protein [Rhabdochlamydiaceae bacterium]
MKQTMEKWFKEALFYAFDLKTEDYTKYISEEFVMHLDGKVFNFKQWVHHIVGLKALMKSYKFTFDDFVIQEDKIASSYIVHATKKDGTELDIRVIAIFKIKNGKFIYCDELTHLLRGPESDKNLASQD